MAKMDAEKNTYGGLERFLYIVLLPTLFAAVLIGVLLTLFDYDVKGTLYDVGRKIPLVKSIVPSEEGDFVNPASMSVLLEEQLEELKGQLAARDAEIGTLKQELADRDEAVKSLEENVETLVIGQEQAALDLAEYRKQLKSMANMYAGMSASKAAAILSRMPLPELVLVLYEMGTDDRAGILARMDPGLAADASLQLKEITEANWAEFESRARQSRESGMDDAGNFAGLSIDVLAGTFAAMEPDSAAAILLELKERNSKRAIAILGAMSDQARSSILSAIADNSPKDAAAFTDELGGR